MALLKSCLSRCLRSHALHSFCWGLLSGLLLICAVAPTRILLGNSLAVDSALLLTGVLCYGLGPILFQRIRSSRFRFAFLMPFAAVWTLLIPVFLRGMLPVLNGFSMESMENPAIVGSVMLAITLLSLAPVLMVMRLHQLELRSSSCRGLSWIAGLAAACAIFPAFVLPATGTMWIVIAAMGASCVMIALGYYFPTGTATLPAQPEESDLATSATSSDIATSISTALTLFLLGGVLALTVSVAGQLIPVSLITETALLAGLLGGVACSRFKSGRGITPSFSMFLMLAAIVSILSVGFPLWTNICLRLNSSVPNVNLLFLSRILLLSLFTLPIGYLAGRLIHHRSPLPMSQLGPWAAPLCLVLGTMIARALPWSPPMAAQVLILAAFALAAAQWSLHRFRLPEGRVRQAIVCSLGIMGLCGILFSGQFDLRQTDRILNSSMALQSYRQGISQSQLSWIDDARELVRFSSLVDSHSLWRQRGVQVLHRQNGLVMGLHSPRQEICPHHPADILPAVLPLSMHTDPETVLVVGIHPASLMACHRWPLRLVQSIDGSPKAHEMLTWLRSQSANGLHLENGPAFRFSLSDPMISLRAQHEVQYDLITCPLVHPSATGSSGLLSREFYQAARRHLSDDGIFSQRIPYYDLGPNVVQEITSTLLEVFGDVLAVESIPGELIFLASPGTLPAVDEKLADRLKAPQSRQLLAEAGWDWSLILGRGALTKDRLAEMVASNSAVNSGMNNRYAFRMPIEVSRWAPKGDHTRQLLSRHGGTLREALGETNIGKEVTDRLEDISMAHQIQRDHPNDPWAYRAALKSRLQERPRTTIMQVNHQLKRTMDPEDQRRKEYLKVLGPVARNPQPDLESVIELCGFEEPFDPLVSPFLYFETANILGRCDPAVPEVQLQHLLHTVYYTSAFDQSVRNVGDALRLICDHPELIQDEALRWDLMNSLAQTLAQRWQLRLSLRQLSKYEVADTEHSLSALNLAMKEMARTHQAAGLSSKEWELRADILERAIMKPLRQHRNQISKLTITPVPVKPAEGT